MPAQFDASFYCGKSWGTKRVTRAWDLPTLKLRYLMEMLAHRSSPGASLLDVGCGGGRMLRTVRELDGRLELTGVDRSGQQIAMARAAHAGANIAYVEADGEALPFADASFDLVSSFDFLEHIERPGVAIQEMSRVIKPGGTLHCVCPVEGERLTPYPLAKTLFGRHFKEQTIGHIQMFTIAEIESYLRGAGFAIEERSYSYHLIGSLMDYLFFASLLNERVAEVYWRHDRYHADETAAVPSPAGRVLNALTSWGNAIAYVESSLLRRVPLFASVLHVTARRSPAAVAET